MRRMALVFCFTFLAVTLALIHPDLCVSDDKAATHVEIFLFKQLQPQKKATPKTGFDRSWDNRDIFMRPYQKDAYGPGIHSDATGRPFRWQIKNGQVVQPGIRVQPDAYGLGVGMDQYGRPIKPSSQKYLLFHKPS